MASVLRCSHLNRALGFKEEVSDVSERMEIEKSNIFGF